MDIRGTSVCSIQEIANLSQNTALQNMKTFCKKAYAYKYNLDPTKNLYCFYFFSEAVYPKDQSGYGYQFAALIRKNNLGNLVETDEVLNVTFHPDHSNKMWVWSPHPVNLYTWYKDNCPEDFKVAPSLMDDALKHVDLSTLGFGTPTIPNEKVAVPTVNLDNVEVEAAIITPYKVNLDMVKAKRKKAVKKVQAPLLYYYDAADDTPF